MTRLRTMLLFTVLLPLAGLSAQRIWSPPSANHYLGVELGKGFFDVGSGHLGFSTMYASVLGRVAVSARVGVTAELPVTHLDWESSDGFKRATSTIGNPWIGVQYLPRPDLSVEAGFRPRVATKEMPGIAALSYATAADFEHLEAWYPQTTSLRAVVRYGRVPDAGGFYNVLVGVTSIRPDHSIAGPDLLIANYGARAGWMDQGTLASITLFGHYLANRHGYSIDERMINEVSAGFERTIGRVRPHATIRSFLDSSYRSGTKAVITVGTIVTF